MDRQRIFTAAALIGLILLAACGGGGGGAAQLATTVPAAAGQGRLDADYLRSHSGITIDGLGFYRLDRDMQLLEDWQGIEVHGSLDEGFRIDCNAATPDDIFLAITYDDDALQLESALLTAPASAGNLILAVTRRIADVTLVGITRTREHGTKREAMTLADVRFRPGSERMWRDLSLVNEDPMSAVELSVTSIDANSLTLEWDERNIGDYDNNGLVSISDITPIGLLFHETLATHDPPGEVTLVDGDGNGEINLADLTPIARNFNRSMDGFSLYAFSGTTAEPSLLEQLQAPAVRRDKVLAAATPAERRQRLHYLLDHSPPGPGTYSLAVRSWSSDGSEGLFSNIVSLTIAPDNAAPLWQGSLQVLPISDGLALTIPQAIDPDGSTVSYRLRYIKGQLPVGLTGTQTVDIPAGIVSGIPPYNYNLTGLVPGSFYSLELTAADSAGARSTALLHDSTRVPRFGADQPGLWDSHAADISGSGTMPGLQLAGPLVLSASLPGTPVDAARQMHPVFASDGDMLYVRGNQLLRISLDGPAGQAVPLEAYGAGDFLASANLVDDHEWLIYTDENALQYSNLLDDSGPFPGDDLLANAPLLLGDYGYSSSTLGHVSRWLLGSAATLFSKQVDGSFSVSPASDGSTVYTLGDNGLLVAVDAASQEILLTLPDRPLPQPGSRLILLPGRSQLIATLPSGDVAVLGTDGTLQHQTDFADTVSHTCALALPWLDPPLLLVGDDDGIAGSLRALSLDDYTLQWQIPLQSTALSADGARIYVANPTGLQLLDFSGRLRQALPHAGNVNSRPVLDPRGMAYASGSDLLWYTPAQTDLPPVWQGTEGLRELTVGDGQVTLHWDQAVDEHGEPVHYAVYYGTAFPPDPDSPATSVVTDIPDAGTPTHDFVLDGLDNGTRYWFIVRAYDGWWDDNPNLEQNLNWLAATPPWLSEELILGEDLPAGEIFYMRGIADPAGSLHLVYNDEATIRLTHLFGGTGNWQHEEAGLTGWPSNAFDLGWDSDLLIGRANNFPPSLSLLSRTGADTYSETVVAGSDPLANPQLAIAVGNEYGLGFTEYISGSLPQVSGHYYYTETSLGSFLPPIPVEEPLFNYGRDLDLLFDPADNISPWLCFQRGTSTTDNRLTPTAGSLQFWRDPGSGLAVEEVDSGVNFPDSDAGKRVRMVLDGSGQPLMAYYDLDSDPLQPRGQLKTARWDGSQWLVNVLENRDLSFQDQFTYRNTAPELDIVSSATGKLAIGELLRANMPASGDQPHSVGVRAWIDSGSGFELEVLTEPLWMLPSDREPCVAMYDAAGILHIFVATAQEPPAGEDYKADTILHLWRGE